VDIIVLIGRILFVVLFLYSSLGHLTASEQLAGYASSRGVPASVARPAVLISGLMLLVGGILVLFGIWADLGALLLVIFLLPTAYLMHGFWRDSGEARLNEQVQFNKDLALAGASLMLFAFFSFVGHELGLTITGPLFNIS
jgi:putative oxidoreductase